MSTLEWRRTRPGLISNIYTEQKRSSKGRGHPPPEYTLEELAGWFETQSNFPTLYKAWVDSGYDKWLRPSTDRLVNTEGYSLKNIQLITFQANNKKSHSDAAEGLNLVSLLKSVDQFDLKGNFIKTYKSLTKASMATGQSVGAICVSCNHKAYSAKKWLWRYSTDSHIPVFRSLGKYVYTCEDCGNGEKVFYSIQDVKNYLGCSDLSPLNRALRKNVKYRGKVWTRTLKD